MLSLSWVTRSEPGAQLQRKPRVRARGSKVSIPQLAQGASSGNGGPFVATSDGRALLLIARLMFRAEPNWPASNSAHALQNS